MSAFRLSTSGRGRSGRGARASSRRRPAPASERRRSFLWRWRRGLFLVGLLFVAAVAGAGYVLAQIELPDEEFQAHSSFICAADVVQDCNQENAMAKLFAEVDRVDVSLEEVPQVMVDAIIAAEDKDFFTHAGVDPIGIARAAWIDIRGGEISQGGSTITQQYVKNVYLNKEQTITRKLKEAVLALKLEQELSKREILERYLNTVYFGRGAYGIGAAVPTYFGHDMSQLDVAEAAYLAGLVRAPEGADGARDPDEATRRRHTVLAAMLEEGYIDQAQFDAADAEPWVVATLPDGSDGTVLPRVERQNLGRVRGAEHGTEYFVEYVRRQLQVAGYTDAQIYGGGLKVYTTLDLSLQQAAWDSVTGTLDREGDPPAALVAVDDQGYVKAMVGGRNFTENQVNLALGAAAGGTGRQAGSAMKPFVLAAAVRQGISVHSRFNSPSQVVIPRVNAGEDYTVNNYGGTEQGVLSLVDATRVSSNTAYAQLMLEVGPENVVPLAQQMGITSPLQPNFSLVLGTAEVSPLDMASAFSTLARDGVHIPPTVITRVESPDGTVRTFEQPRVGVLTKEETDIVSYCLRQVVEGGTGTAARLGVPAAGKTGTTQDNRDAWFVGYTPNGYTTAVWMGYDPDPEGNPRFMDDVHGREVVGGSFPAEIWHDFMGYWTDGVDVGSFTTPTRFPGEVLNSRLETTTTLGPNTTTTTVLDTTTTLLLPPSTEPPTSVTLPDTTTLPPCGNPPTTTDPTQPCDRGD